VILGSLLRLVLIDFNPPSLNWDEVSHGYNAYSVLKTGSDEWEKLPITNFRAYGDYPASLNLYLTVPFIALMGLNDLAIRLPHALLGILTIISVYFFAFGLTKDRSKSLFASFLVSVSPWYVFTSRFVLQSNLSVFLVIFGMALFFNRERRKIFLPLSLLCLELSMFAYHTTRIFTPILLLLIILIYRKELSKYFKGYQKSAKWLTVFLFGIFFLTLTLIAADPSTRARSKEVFLIDQGALEKIIEKRNLSNFDPLVTRLIYNRPVYFLTEFSKNYIDYFSPTFLFMNGGTQYQFSVPKQGLEYLIYLPFFYFGLYILSKKVIRKDKNSLFLLLWFLLSPVVASITKERFAVLRSTTMLPLVEVLITFGFFNFVEFINKKLIESYRILIFSAFGVAIFLSVDNYLDVYFNEYRVDYSWSWQYGYKEVVSFVKEKYSGYDKIIISKKYGEPHEFLLFYWPWDPAKYKNDQNLIRFYQSNWYWVDRFDKFYFVNDWDIGEESEFVLESDFKVDCMRTKCLLVTSPGNYPKDWQKLKEIDFLNGESAFEIYEN
jgi:4-amino-4-deoxy-L-arabinose transferase-like glycosyltransferase